MPNHATCSSSLSLFLSPSLSHASLLFLTPGFVSSPFPSIVRQARCRQLSVIFPPWSNNWLPVARERKTSEESQRREENGEGGREGGKEVDTRRKGDLLLSIPALLLLRQHQHQHQHHRRFLLHHCWILYLLPGYASYFIRRELLPELGGVERPPLSRFSKLCHGQSTEKGEKMKEKKCQGRTDRGKGRDFLKKRRIGKGEERQHPVEKRRIKKMVRE